MTMNESIKIKIPKSELGLAGHYSELIVVPEYEGETKTKSDTKLYDTETRKFQVYAILRKYYSDDGDLDFELTEEMGNSYLILPDQVNGKKIKLVRLQSSGGEFSFYRNLKNELSLIKFECEDKRYSAAVKKFFSGLTPYLDFIAYTYNVPVQIDKVCSMDLKNGTQSLSFTRSYENVSAILPPMEIREELFPIFSLYREAKSSSSNYYKFLCYFKILEGIFRMIRPNFMSKVKKEKLNITKVKDIVPGHPELLKFNNPNIGKPIQKLFETIFENEYRHAISHFSLRNGAVLNLSDYNNLSKFSQVTLLIDICCRVVIESQVKLFNEYDQLKKTHN